ncbi:MAG: hypothetical protein ABIH26_03950 [Candidatus Eisenbacteria bacterium]
MGRTKIPVAIAVLAALLVPILGVLPPAQFFRLDDFAWLTWAKRHGVADAFDSAQAPATPGGRFRPAHALFWILGSRVFGPESAVPWILLSSSFFAAGIALLLLWGDCIDPRKPHAGKAAAAIWFAGFFPMLYLLLNVYNNGKTMVFFLIPVAVCSGISFYERRRSLSLLVCLLAFVIGALARESVLAIVPAAVGAYALADLRERGKPLLPLALGALLAVAVLLAAGAALSPLIRGTLQDLARGEALAPWGGNLMVYAREVLWEGYRRYLWLGLVIAASYRRSSAFMITAVAVLLADFLFPRLSPLPVLILLLLFWVSRMSKMNAALLAWFAAAYLILLPARDPAESYFLEAAVPLALFLGIEVKGALASIAGRARGALRWGEGRKRWTAIAAWCVLVLLAAACAAGVYAVYTRDLLPVKRHGADFAEANRFMVRELPMGSAVHVFRQEEIYGEGLAEYIRRFRRFYLWKDHPECWFAAYDRPDVKVVYWTGKPDARAPAFFFASTPFEKDVYREESPAPGAALIFENRSSEVYDLRPAADPAL